MFSHLFKKKILFISGKGGTGKSLIAAMLGMLAAQEGKRVLLAEAQAFDKLSPLFGLAPIGHNEVQVRDRLHCINLDAKRCFQEYVTLHLGMEHLYDRVFRNQLVSSLLEAIPGLDETMLLGRLFYTSELSSAQKYDLIIFDAPASGHFLNMMATPDAIIQSGLVGPLIHEVTRVKAFLEDSEKCGSLIVTLPESLVMNETVEFLPILAQKSPVELSAIVLNRLHMYAPETLPPALQNYFDRKMHETENARKELVDLLKKTPFCKHIYAFPDLQALPEPLSNAFIRQLSPLIEGITLATEPT